MPPNSWAPDRLFPNWRKVTFSWSPLCEADNKATTALFQALCVTPMRSTASSCGSAQGCVWQGEQTGW
jgi:hypothetical protein